MLTVRGVFSSPIYQVNSADPTSFDLSNNKVRIDATSPAGIPQDLDALKDLIDPNNQVIPAGLVLTSPIDDAIYAVVEVEQVTVSGSGPTESITIDFHRTPGSGQHLTQYLALSSGSGQWPTDLT